MIYLYLFYGLAFIATGLILGLQGRLPFGVLPRRAVILLAIFALIHGAAEWMTMGLLIEGRGAPGRLSSVLRTLVPLLSVLSFAVLLQFALELWVVLAGKTRWLRLAPPALSAVALGFSVPAIARGEAGAPAAEAAVRYGLATAASLLAALGLLMARRAPSPLMTQRHRRLLALGAVTFFAYALFAGLVTPPAHFLFASRFNTETFAAWTHVPVQGLRAACAASLGVILSETFVVEVDRVRRDLEQQREEFIAVVAHDLRGPINIIGLSTSLLERQLAGRSENNRGRELVGGIRRSGQRLERMVSDLLDASRVEARRLSLQLRPTDLHALILGVLDRAAAFCAGHTVRAALPDSLPNLDADPDRLEQVFENLLSNAGKYSQEGSEIVVAATVRSDELEVAVTNLGEGLSHEEITQIFTRFYRAPGAADKASGLGIGLYVAKGLVEAHGGRIWVDAEPEQNTFRFTLPRPKRPQAD